MVQILAISLAAPQAERRASGEVALSLLCLDGWAPAGGALACLNVRASWWRAAATIDEAAAAADAVVLFAPTSHLCAKVARFAWNGADPTLPDEDGMRWPGFELVPFAAPINPATLSPYAMARAIELCGLTCEVDENPPADIANRALYALTRPGRVRSAALVRLPSAIEQDRAGDRGRANRMQILRGVQGAIAFAAAAAERSRLETSLPFEAEAN